MPSPRSPLRSSLPRLALRASLLSGALLDSAFGIVALGSVLGFQSFDPLLNEAVSYSRQLAAPIVCRAAVQLLACYDRRRYDPMIPVTALTLAASGIVGLGGAGLLSATAKAMIALGALQLISWRTSRT